MVSEVEESFKPDRYIAVLRPDGLTKVSGISSLHK